MSRRKTEPDRVLIDRLTTVMVKRGTNPHRVSVAAGLGDTAVSDILQGRNRNPSIRPLQRIAKALDTNVGYLVGERDDDMWHWREMERQWIAAMVLPRTLRWD